MKLKYIALKNIITNNFVIIVRIIIKAPFNVNFLKLSIMPYYIIANVIIM